MIIERDLYRILLWAWIALAIPVFLVLAEINLLGAWTVGWRELQRT